MPHSVAFLGFTESERHALSSYLRLAHHRSPSYMHVATLTDADLLVADADHAPSVQLVVVTERMDETVFIGAQAPAGSATWMRRPIDALQLMRELDGIVARRRPNPEAPSDDDPHTTLIQAMHRKREAQPAPGVVHPAPLTLREAAPELAAGTRSTQVPMAALPSGLPRALLVDDSDIALLFLQTRLERWQIQTDTASNSQAALDLLAQHSYDLVFLDVELGQDSELDGLGLCRHIKQTPASMNALVVMVSAHHSELVRVRCALAGCDAYLSKPLAEAEWVRLLQRQGLRQKAEAGSIPG
jgi:CheY-like chemotaxis protein